MGIAFAVIGVMAAGCIALGLLADWLERALELDEREARTRPAPTVRAVPRGFQTRPGRRP